MSEHLHRLPAPDRPPVDFTKLTEPFVRLVQAQSNGAATLSTEVANFVTNRAQKTNAAVTELTGAPNPAAALDVQYRWWLTALRDYSDQAQRMVSIGGHIMQDMLETSKQGVAELTPSGGQQPQQQQRRQG